MIASTFFDHTTNRTTPNHGQSTITLFRKTSDLTPDELHQVLSDLLMVANEMQPPSRAP